MIMMMICREQGTPVFMPQQQPLPLLIIMRKIQIR